MIDISRDDTVFMKGSLMLFKLTPIYQYLGPKNKQYRSCQAGLAGEEIGPKVLFSAVMPAQHSSARHYPKWIGEQMHDIILTFRTSTRRFADSIASILPYLRPNADYRLSSCLLLGTTAFRMHANRLEDQHHRLGRIGRLIWK